VDAFFRAWRGAGFRPVGHIVWAKDYASRTRYLHYRHEQAYVLAKGSPKMPQEPIDDVQPWVYSGNPDHPTQKAVQILTPLIKAFSQPGQLVLDPFAGSGSTLVAAAISGRRYLGVELEQGYCRVARERLARVHARLPQTLPMHAVLDQEELDLVPADVDGFIQWLREHQLEGVARVVESAKAEYGW
jgi:site-specific DNA-methyltransferase (adenine-specific)